MSLKFYQCIIHFPNHDQNSFDNVTNTLSPNMMEDWTIMHALICPSTAWCLNRVCVRGCTTHCCHLEYIFLWISIRCACCSLHHFKVWEHSYVICLCFTHCCFIQRSWGIFMAVTGQNLRNTSVGGWRAETAFWQTRSPVLPGLCIKGLLALWEVAGCCPGSVIWWRWTVCLC